MTSPRVALALALALAPVLACQRSDPPRAQPDPSQLVSRAEEAAPGESGPGESGPGESAPGKSGPRGAQVPVPPLPDPLPGKRRDVTSIVGSSARAAIADLDGDGRRELVLVDASQMRVVDPATGAGGRELARAPVSRGIQLLVAADVDGPAIFAGWGMTREHRDSRAAVTVHRLEHGHLVEQPVLAPETTRHDVVAIVPMPEERAALIAYFDSKYMVSSVVARRAAQGWETSRIASLRTATSYARGDVDGDGKPDIVIGRVYGDGKASDGDAFVLGPDGGRTPIPTTRGLRSIAVADADGDGRPEIFLGDGWHQNYAAEGRGLLSWSRFENGVARTELIEDTPGQYGIDQLVPATIDGRLAIVARGSHYVRVFTLAEDGWHGQTIAGQARDIAVGDLDGKPGDEILIVGDRSEIVDLSR